MSVCQSFVFDRSACLSTTASDLWTSACLPGAPAWSQQCASDLVRMSWKRSDNWRSGGGTLGGSRNSGWDNGSGSGGDGGDNDGGGIPPGFLRAW